MPPWIFCTSAATPLDESKVRRVFGRLLKAAGLPPHSLRHTFASLLLQQGESPAYVQRQLGHASIQLTVDTYGKWLPMGNKAAVNRLDDPSGSKTVASEGSGDGERPGSTRKDWSRGRDLNPRPADYESAALPLSYPGVRERASTVAQKFPGDRRQDPAALEHGAGEGVGTRAALVERAGR